MTVQRLAAWASITAVAVVVAAGLTLSGSPAQQRLKRLDERRVSHLQRLVGTLDRYHTQNDSLPDGLAPLVDGRRLSRMPSDPVTGLPYPYTRLAPDQYRLCATFDSASVPPPTFWSHPAGPHCYQFSVPKAPDRSLSPD